MNRRPVRIPSKPNIDIGLSVLCLLAAPEQTLTQQEIAEVCECSEASISRIETAALQKFKVRALRMGLNEYLD